MPRWLRDARRRAAKWTGHVSDARLDPRALLRMTRGDVERAARLATSLYAADAPARDFARYVRRARSRAVA